MTDFSRAILSLQPQAQFVIDPDNSLDNLVWHDENIPRPTDQEILDEADRLSITMALSKIRKAKELGGFTMPGGLGIPTDEKTERRIMGAYTKAQVDSNYSIASWTTDGGLTHTALNATAIIAIGDAFDAHIQSCFDAEAAITGNTYASIKLMEAAFDKAYDAAQDGRIARVMRA